MKVVLAAGACLALTACATSSANIAATYSSPFVYGDWSCRQLAMEDQDLLGRVSSLRGQIDRRATNDKIAMGVAVVAFWPALFFVKGDGEQAAEYARLKGQHEAITRTAEQKRCVAGAGAIAFEPAPPPPGVPGPAAIVTAAAPSTPTAAPAAAPVMVVASAAAPVTPAAVRTVATSASPPLVYAAAPASYTAPAAYRSNAYAPSPSATPPTFTTVRAVSETERMRTPQPMVDNYGR